MASIELLPLVISFPENALPDQQENGNSETIRRMIIPNTPEIESVFQGWPYKIVIEE